MGLTPPSVSGGYYSADMHDMINLYLPSAGSGSVGGDGRDLASQHYHAQHYSHQQQPWMSSVAGDTARLMQHPIYASGAADLAADSEYSNMAARLSTSGVHGYQLTHTRLV
jgi:hypothetical protein